MKSHSLKYLRIVAGLLMLVALTAVFIDFTGNAAAWLAWTAKIQLLPALLAVNFVTIAIFVVLTLVFGRLYCSVICPLGITQDILIWLRRIFAKRNKRRLGLFRFKPAKKAVRYSFFGLFIVLLVAGLLALLPSSIAGILDPYSAYGRIASQGLAPAWRATFGSFAQSQAESGNFIVAGVPSALALFNLAVAIVAAATFIVVAVFAFRTGRGYCNTVCPVGTLLGFLSRFSLLRPVIDTDKCNRCGSCGRHCKAQCIDTKNHRIDYSRCIVCFDCINNCSQGAISYRRAPRTSKETKTDASVNAGRRSFLIGASALAASAASAKVTDGGLSPVKKKQRRPDAAPAVPAGAASLAHFRSHCTACQLCISNCPEHILRPSTDFNNFMQPVMVFTEGYCSPDCTRCGEVCPTGAIKPIDVATKSSVKIGTAHVDPSICISAAYGKKCGNCARHCPGGAIQMITGPDGKLVPSVDPALCIGCGACELHCPSGSAGILEADHAAIYVVGAETHQTI